MSCVKANMRRLVYLPMDVTQKLKKQEYNDNQIRDIIIIYGFFFVMLSALLPASISAFTMSIGIRRVLYLLTWPMALASGSIGMGLLEMLGDRIHAAALLGFFVLSVIVPIAFVIFVGTLLLYDQVADFNSWTMGFLIIFCLSMIAASAWERWGKPWWRAIRKSQQNGGQEKQPWQNRSRKKETRPIQILGYS